MELVYILKNIIETLNDAKKLRICHRDIKPANILFSTSQNCFKIIDFSESKIVSSSEMKACNNHSEIINDEENFNE